MAMGDIEFLQEEDGWEENKCGGKMYLTVLYL